MNKWFVFKYSLSTIGLPVPFINLFLTLKWHLRRLRPTFYIGVFTYADLHLISNSKDTDTIEWDPHGATPFSLVLTLITPTPEFK